MSAAYSEWLQRMPTDESILAWRAEGRRMGYMNGSMDPYLRSGIEKLVTAYAGRPRLSVVDEPKAETVVPPDLRDVFESLLDTTEYPFLVERMFRLGYFALLAAYESTGKSYIGTQIALSVIVRRPVFGEFAVNDSMGVCVFDMEMGEAEDRNRDRQMMADMGIEPEQVKGLYRRITLDDASLSLKDPDHVAYIGAQLDKAHEEMGRPILAILDSTDSMVSKRPWGEDAEALDRAISQLRAGRRAWLVVLLLCHTKKRPSEGKADYVRDLEDVLGNLTRQADMAMVLDLKGALALRCGIYKRPGRSAGILQRDEDPAPGPGRPISARPAVRRSTWPRSRSNCGPPATSRRTVGRRPT